MAKHGSTASGGIKQHVSIISGKQGQGGEQLFSIGRSLSKERRKIEIQNNLQRKREMGAPMRDSVNSNNSNADIPAFQSNSTIDREAEDSQQQAPATKVKKF